MKEDWEIKKLNEVCDLKHGYAFDGNDFGNEYLSENPIVLTPGNFCENSTLMFNEKNTKRCFGEYPKEYQFRIGDLVVVMTDLSSKMKILGKPAIIEKPNILHNQRIGKFVFFNNSIQTRFLYYFLQTESYLNRVKDTATGTMVRHTAPKRILDFRIPIPSISEQKHIIAILDEAFASIAKAKANVEQNLKNARELFEGYLQEVFLKKGEEWKEKTIKEIGHTQTGTTPKTADKENYGDYIPFIKPADIDIKGNGEIRYDNDGLSKQGLSNGRKMLEGSILMVCIGATIGKVGIVDRDVSCNQQINSLTVNEEFSPKFIYYALSTIDFFEQVMHNAAQATLPIINKGKWEKLKVSFPKSKADQVTIANKLDSLQNETQKLEAVYQQKLNDLDELKKSILQKAFSGEL